MECYLGHLDGVLVSLKHYLVFTWILYYDKYTKLGWEGQVMGSMAWKGLG